MSTLDMTITNRIQLTRAGRVSNVPDDGFPSDPCVLKPSTVNITEILTCVKTTNSFEAGEVPSFAFDITAEIVSVGFFFIIS